MPLTIPQIRTLRTLLRFGFEQIEEAQSIIFGIAPRTSNEAGLLRRLKDIQLRIQEEQAGVERMLATAEKTASGAKP
jgi:hypothetical protein